MLALSAPLVFAQVGDGGAASTAAANDAGTAGADGGVGAFVSSGAGAAATDGGPGIVTSGSAATGADAGTPVSTSGLTEITEEAPAAAVAPRPEPTPEQIAALRLLEAEVEGFGQRGQAFRTSINGLLRRAHESQLDRLRRGFDRQIAAEREAEAQARRHAIQIFTRFLELYPDDPDHTPDVMFRLAELFYDEAAYAKLEADERIDQLRAQREAAGQDSSDLVAPPVDYRCSILLYRHITQRFPGFRLRDATHYLLGWVLKEMGQEEESITSYRGLVCPARYHYQSRLDLMASLVPGQDTPVACPRVFDILRPYGAELITPPNAVAATGAAADGGAPAGESMINAGLVAAGQATDTEPMPIPRDYAECTPLNGANGRPSRYAAEVWYYIGDYHFDNPPSDPDLGNAYAIAAYQAAMRASEVRRPAGAINGAGRTGATPGLQGAQDTGTAGGVTPATSPGRAQFSADINYGPFWSKSLYKIGWSYFRMINGYPRALEAFSRLLDYYDWAGAEVAAQGNRTDTIKWIGVIFSEGTWGLATNTDGIDCQPLVETVARPPADAPRPFDCAGILRITSPLPLAQIMAARDAAAARITPVPGRVAYIPQDRPWTPEAYLELANDYFQQTKYYEAITLYRIFLRLYPLHFQAPRVAENIAIAYERQRQFDAAISARGRLADYTEHTPWWDANNSHPEAQRYAELVARNSLHDNAIQHHQRASQARQQSINFRRCSAGTTIEGLCTGARTPRERQERDQQAFAALQRANEEYALAIDAYNRFIENYPNDEAAYEFRYNRADAMFWAGRYVDAARAYGDVRESNENDQYLAAAAFMAVKALEAQIRLSAQSGQLDPCLAVRAGINAAELRNPQTGQPLLDEARATQCTEIPTTAPAAAAGAQPAAGARPTIQQLNLHDLVRQLMEARVAYTNRVPRALDSARGLGEVFSADPEHPENNPPFRPKFAYLNARTLLRYGHVADAERLYRQILQTYCDDATVAGASLIDLRNLLVVQNREDDLEALAREQTTNRTCAGVQTDVLRADLTNAQFRHALDIFHQAERASGPEALQLYERAANEMLRAVNANRNHPQAPLAMFFTALAYERTNRFDTATQTYIRITQEYNNLNVIGSSPPRELEGEARQERINILEVSNFRAAVNLDRTFDYDNAVRYFNIVVSDPRFGNAENHADHVHDSLATIALIQTNLGRWPQAREAWRAFLPRAAEGRERATAQYRIAEMPFRAQDWAGAVRSLQDYRRTTPMTPDTAEFHVQAQYNIATAWRNQGNQANYQRELRAVARVFRESRQPPASRAAGYAAEALFLDLDRRVSDFMRRTLTQGTGVQLAAQIRALKTELDGIDTQAQEIVDLAGGEYSIAALVRRAEAHEYLATQEVRISQLLQLSTQQQRQLARAEAGAARLERLADQLGGRNEALETQLRNRAQEIRDHIQQMRDQMTTQVQQQYDREAESERKLAIQDFAIAIHLSRRDNIPTQYAGRALEHIRLEENRPLVDEAVRAIRPEVLRAARFTYSPNMFNTEAPGATLTEQQLVATPGLAGE
jgi:tetratricopeptide (TPR) repeat protein